MQTKAKTKKQKNHGAAYDIWRSLRSNKVAVVSMVIIGILVLISILADVLFDYGINSTIAGLKTNLPNVKIFGRANTLKIRKLNQGEDYRGIYKGLETYSKISRGEVIIVENEIEDRA